MRELVILFVHAIATLARLLGPGGMSFPPLLATIAPQKRKPPTYFPYLQVPLSSVFATMASAIFGRNRAFVRCAAEKGRTRPQHGSEQTPAPAISVDTNGHFADRKGE